MRLTIGIAGRARHGKGTTALALKQYCDDRKLLCQIISFADPLKDFLSSMVGREEPFRGSDVERNAPLPEITWDMLSPDMAAEVLQAYPNQDFSVNPTGRQLMQLFGSNVVRNRFCSVAWTLIAGNRAKKFNGITVIDDVRFPNEARHTSDKSIFDLLLKVQRPGIPLINHVSETSVDLIPTEWFNHQFVNDGEAGFLRHKVYTWACSEIKGAD